jgi:hypothetical protein
MSKKQDELFSPDEDEEEALEEFERLSRLLFEHVNAFAEEENVSDEILPFLVLQLSVTLRMGSYVMSTAKPSAGGLKLDLDRFRREADDLIRETKKDAERFIEDSKRRLAELELEEDEE